MSKIISKLIEIAKVENPTTKYIEKEFEKRSIEVLRWAIVEIKENSFVINLACFE